MRRGWALALSLLILAGGALLWLHSVHEPIAHRTSLTGITKRPRARTSSGSSLTAPPRESEDAARSAATAQTFNQRLRCTQTRLFLKRAMPPQELALLCARRPLAVLQIEAPLAQAGDPHAMEVLGIIGNGGRCDLLSVASTLPNHRANMLALAQKNGATRQTTQRLDDLLSEEQQGPTVEELEACRQSNEVFRKLQPGMLQQFVAVLGRSVQALRGEDELEVEIEYARKTLLRGDAEAEEALATLLLQKRTPDSQAEAVTLLRDAADSSPSAKPALARCMLQTPAPDRSGAHQLLVDAATSGDLFALMTLAEPASPEYDLYPDLPAPERYAWGEFLQRLHSRGAYGRFIGRGCTR
jgi:hypothetical protein